MIHHFVNLVVWEDIASLYDPKRDILHCDSLSFKIACKLVAELNIALNPGSSVLQSHEQYFSAVSPALFLTSRSSLGFEGLKHVPLPADLDISDDKIIDDLCHVTIDMPIFIGISSPKQNFLAVKLFEKFPSLEIYCIGAVLDAVGNNSQGNIKDLSGSGLEWLMHLGRDPRRFFKKVSRIFVSVFQLATSKSYRVQFIRFCYLLSRQTGR